VGISKSILRRTDENKIDIQLMILEYRNSVIIGSKFFPALLMSQSLTSKIPVFNNSLKLAIVND